MGGLGKLEIDTRVLVIDQARAQSVHNDRREQMANGFQFMPENSRVYSVLSPSTMARCPTQYVVWRKRCAGEGKVKLTERSRGLK